MRVCVCVYACVQFYRPLKVRVALTGLEVWSERDQIKVEKNPAHTLYNFLEWRSRELLPRLRHDNAQLVMYVVIAAAARQWASKWPCLITMCTSYVTGAAPLQAPL